MLIQLLSHAIVPKPETEVVLAIMLSQPRGEVSVGMLANVKVVRRETTPEGIQLLAVAILQWHTP
jgi:hypothetical protein